MPSARRTSPGAAFPPITRRRSELAGELTATAATRLLSLRRAVRARRVWLLATMARLGVLLIGSRIAALRAARGSWIRVRPLVDRAATGSAHAAAAGLRWSRAVGSHRFRTLRGALVPAFGPQAGAAAALLVATLVLTTSGLAAASVQGSSGRPGRVAVAATEAPLATRIPANLLVDPPTSVASPRVPAAPAAPPPDTSSGVVTAASSSPVQVDLTPVPPSERGALPLGKGMWLWLPDRVEGGDVDALVARSRQVGLTHLYVRTGSSRGGFYAAPYLDELLPKAHAAGIRIYGWDFPYLEDVGGDIGRAVAAISHTTPTGHRIDGFAADIETPSEGTNLTVEGVASYGAGLRSAVGDAYPLIAVVPRPSAFMLQRFPYTEATAAFDAIAPMTYWLNRQPDTDVINDVTILSQLGKPVIPIGQAYDGAPEGGRPGPPPPEEITRFLAAAEASGAVGASFWSWQHASPAIFDAIAAAPEFRWSAGSPEQLRPGQVRALQAQLSALGHPVATSGAWDPTTTDAVLAYQRRARLTPTGVLDEATVRLLLAPFAPPVGAR